MEQIIIYFINQVRYLGKKISLIGKPYYAMFKIVMNNDFEELVNLNVENEQLSKDILIKVDETKFHNIKNLRKYNLIVSDTSKINLEQDFAYNFLQIPPHEGHHYHLLTVRHYKAL